MSRTQVFFLNNRCVGTAKVPDEWYDPRHGMPVKTQGLALFCAECSELWFNAPVDGRPTSVFYHECHRHPHRGDQVPGAIWNTEYPPVFLDFLPPAVLCRDLLLYLEHYGYKEMP